MKMVKVFEYLEKLDCFVVSSQYKSIAETLGLSEWHEAVWIGRYFALDNDYGEHWFDNWDLREKIAQKINPLGIDESEVLVIDPDRFKNDYDGPCHSGEERKQFWTDVLTSLKLSYVVLFAEARLLNEERRHYDTENFITDLENRIDQIKSELDGLAR